MTPVRLGPGSVVTVVDDRQLPGGLPARVRWRYGIAWKGVLGSILFNVLALGYGIARGVVSGHIAVDTTIVVVLLVVIDLGSFLRRPGVRVIAASQPELFAVVADVAQRSGLRPPDRIWLTHTTTIEAKPRAWRRELLIGRALVPCLSELEFRTLVAHEVAILQFRRPRPVVRLLRLWSATTVLAMGSSRPAKDARMAADLQPLAEAVHAVADAAATGAAGQREVAASAFIRQAVVDVDYDDLIDATDAPPKRWWQNRRMIEDLDDAWQRWIAREPPTSLRGPDGQELIDLVVDRQHPGLAGAGRERLCVSLAPSAPPVPIRPLTSRQQRRLARHLRGVDGREVVRWYTFATAPAHWWTNRARKEADGIRKSVTTVLGRPPVDDFETAEVLITRNDEILAVLGSPPDDPPAPDDPSSPDPSDYRPPPVLCGLVEDALLPRGWRLEHPAIRGVLIGPQGERVDAARSVIPTGTGYDLEPLRRILRQ